MYLKHIEVQTGERIHACYVVQTREGNRVIRESRAFASSSFSAVVRYAISLAIESDVELKFNEAALLVAETIQPGYAQEAINSVVVGRAV